MNNTPDLATLIDLHRGEFVGFLRRIGGHLRRYESAEDLAQGAALHALQVSDRFAYQGDAAFVGWFREVARRYVARRTAYWRALKRDAGPLLRITLSDATEPGSGRGVNPEALATGPTTFADRRAQVEVAIRALNLLPARDRQLVEAVARGHSIDETAQQMGLSRAAAQRARLRAQERFRQTFALAMRRRHVQT